jgi:hypothetical protein
MCNFYRHFFHRGWVERQKRAQNKNRPQKVLLQIPNPVFWFLADINFKYDMEEQSKFLHNTLHELAL